MQEEPMNELPDAIENELPAGSQPQETLSRRKRGVGPVVGMPCGSGYKLIGDDCVRVNVPFE